MSKKNPVLLIHGIYDTLAKFNTMSAYLAARGWEIHRINLNPNFGKARLDYLATQVADYINNNFSSSQPIDLVGFSMGGLVTRYYLQRLGGIERVQRYISISAPNNGTLLAYCLPLDGIAQMRPNSEFLADLNQDVRQSLGEIDCSFLWTPYDLMILPPHSSRIGVGQEIQLPVLVHAWMVTDRRTLDQIAQILSKPVRNLI